VTTFRVVHRTEYRYATPVTSSSTLAHVQPRPTVTQRVITADVATDPQADRAHWHLDGFGNLVAYLAVERPHDRLQITATCEVEVDAAEVPENTPRWDGVAAALANDVTDDGLLARACSVASPLVEPSAELAEYAAPSFPPGAAIGAALRDLSRRIHEDFVFDAGFSDVTTPVAEIYQARRGVCQDFAHLTIGCLRSLGLPARYVSGYIETLPPPGEPKLAGVDASHAWCAAYVPGWGWLDLDPTNDQVPPRQHVTTAWGRDYSDVVPVRGVVFGPVTDQQLTVAVDVIRR
jgi:transglutaminase-like putative cysteine protease